MTIKINGNHGINPARQTNGVKKTQESPKTGSVQKGDKVDFSAALQNVNRARESSSGMDVERAQKVQALKAQVAEGSYRPDPTKVAASLLKFIGEGK